MESAMNEFRPSAQVDLVMDAKGAPLLQLLFHEGVRLKAMLGISVRNALAQFGIADQYIDDEIGAIFLDGKCVDNVDESIVGPESSMALSAALPGLVGATLRKGGYYAGLRSGITDIPSSRSIAPQRGLLTLRLFNAVAQDLAPAFLARGIFISGWTFGSLLASRADEFARVLIECRISGRSVTLDELAAHPCLLDDSMIRLTVSLPDDTLNGLTERVDVI
jgi:hypothetical protein